LTSTACRSPAICGSRHTPLCNCPGFR
jgi:hypothetical protein